MWFYARESDAIEILTCLTTGAQVVRSGDGEYSEIFWRGNVIDRPLEQDEMKLAGADGERHFRGICDALLKKGLLAGYVGPVQYPVPGE